MEEFVLFLLSFIFVFLIYQIFIVRKAKLNGKVKKSKKKKVPIEVTYLEKKYKLNLKKVNYNQLLHIIACVSSFDIALIVLIICLFDNFLLEIIGGFIFTIVIIMLSYHFLYLFYKRKGMIDSE